MKILKAQITGGSTSTRSTFTELRQARLDLTAIGLQMQAFEANLVHLQAQLSDQGARR